MQRILSGMRHNPNVTKAQLVVIIGISDTAIDNVIRFSRGNYLEGWRKQEWLLGCKKLNKYANKSKTIS